MWVYNLFFSVREIISIDYSDTFSCNSVSREWGKTHNNKNDHDKYLKRMCLRTGSNRGSSVYETDALPLGHEGCYSSCVRY